MPGREQRLHYNGVILTDHQTLAAAGVKNDDMITVARIRPTAQAPPVAAAPAKSGASNPFASFLDGALSRVLGPGGSAAGAAAGQPRPAPFDLAAIVKPFTQPSSDSVEGWTNQAKQFVQHVRAQADLLAAIASRQPNLHEAIEKNNVQGLAGFLKDMAARIEEDRLNRLVQTHPDHPDAQRHIEETIRRKDIEAQWEHAMEHNPEAFASVVMLYCHFEVNKHPITALIDSGAQMTIMSKSCAERCGLMRFVDTRAAGFARGVGESKILGKIHSAVLKVGTQFLDVSISVIDQDTLEFIFGLDMMRKHGAVIDLKQNSITLGDEKIPFLSEGEMPDRLRGSNAIKTSSEITKDRIAIEEAKKASLEAAEAAMEAAKPSSMQVDPPAIAPAPSADSAKARELAEMMNVPLELAMQALATSNGDMDTAASLLLSSSR